MSTDARGAGRIGVLVPYTNVNLEPDASLLCPQGVSVHFARIGGYDVDETPDERQTAGFGTAPIEGPLGLLAGARPGVVLYGCTSATLTHGPRFDRDLTARIRRHVGAPTITAAGALVLALRNLGVTRIGFASPYVPGLNDRAIEFLAGSGFEAVSRAQVRTALGNHEQGALSPDAVFELGLRADSDAAEAIVLSSTDMRSVEVIERLETATGKPVVASNQALMFVAARALGAAIPGRFFGRLARVASAAA